jgi:hypothetical protein
MMALLQDAKPKKRRAPLPTASSAPSSDVSHKSTQRASTPFMITKQMRVELQNNCGLSEAEIRKLTPEKAHKILKAANSSTNSTATSTTAPSTTTTVASSKKQRSRDSISSSNPSEPPTSMAGPMIGGIFGGGLALTGAGYYFFGVGEDDENSVLNTVVQMIRGDKDEQQTKGRAEEMSLEEYEKMQENNRLSFSKKLETMKDIQQSNKKETSEWNDYNGASTTSNQNITPQAKEEEKPRKMTMMEKLEEAKRRGATAGISAQKLKKMKPQKPAWMIEEEKKRKSKSTEDKDSVTLEETPFVPSPDSSTVSITEKIPGDKSTSDTDSNDTTNNTLPLSIQQEEERTPEEKLIAGLESMLTRQREREAEYKKLHNLNSGGIWGKRSISGLNDAQHQVVLDGFKSEKARIKKSIKEILSASNN